MPHSPLNIVIIGSDGRLGSSLAAALSRKHRVLSIGHEGLDLASPASIERTLAPLAYDRLFLTAALTAVDYCEDHSEEAFRVNAESPGLIAGISSSKDAHVTFISTDLVFDGTKPGAYTETDLPNPLSAYGASKLEGEMLVAHASHHNLIVRTSWLYGPGRPAFPEWIIGKACTEHDLTLPGDKTCCPTSTTDLVDWLDFLTNLPAGPPSGILHLCNANPCTWRDWGQFCIDTARAEGYPVIADDIRGIPVSSVPAFTAKRPLNSSLDTSRFTSLTGIHPRDWKIPLREFICHNEMLSNRLRSCTKPELQA